MIPGLEVIRADDAAKYSLWITIMKHHKGQNWSTSYVMVFRILFPGSFGHTVELCSKV